MLPQVHGPVDYLGNMHWNCKLCYWKGNSGFVYDYWGGGASEFSSGFIKELNKPKGSSEDKKK